MRQALRRSGVAGLAVLMAGALSPSPAWALEAPDIEAIPLTTPADPEPGPITKMKQSSQCAVSTSMPGSANPMRVPANIAFGVDALHEFATGDGITVAVIDSGVNKNDRLPRLQGGGDYIGEGNGLSDCDHHGTLIAGIIGAQPSNEDTFVGVAPDASLISIRQSSSAYSPEDTRDGEKAAGSATLTSLARAVVRAANMGADVINLSVTACYPATSVVDTSDLGKALRYAVEKKDVVVVTAAGNSSDASCKPNPGWDAANAGDDRNWDGVRTISMPSYFSPLVVSVGGAALDGQVYTGTMTGPWVDVAGPAMNIVSLDASKSNGSLTNASLGRESEPQAIHGTSFASAYVAGLAALIRQRYPELNAIEVGDRLRATALTASATQRGAFGAGLVDPMAALTWTGGFDTRDDAPQSRQARIAAPETDWTWLKSVIALGISGVAIVVAVAVLGLGSLRGARSRRIERTTSALSPVQGNGSDDDELDDRKTTMSSNSRRVNR